MVIPILAYSSSPFNPLLKLLVLAGFFLAALILYRCRNIYGGLLQKISVLLMAGSVAAILSASMRLLGDYYSQFKWGESIFDLVFVIVTLLVAIEVRRKMIQVEQLFVPSEEKP
jgi:hypothetical protein